MEPSLYLATVFNIAGIDQSLNPGALFTPTPGLMLVNQGGMGLGLNLGTGAGDIFFDFVGDTLGEATITPDQIVNATSPFSYFVDLGVRVGEQFGDWISDNSNQIITTALDQTLNGIIPGRTYISTNNPSAIGFKFLSLSGSSLFASGGNSKTLYYAPEAGEIGIVDTKDFGASTSSWGASIGIGVVFNYSSEEDFGIEDLNGGSIGAGGSASVFGTFDVGVDVSKSDNSYSVEYNFATGTPSALPAEGHVVVSQSEVDEIFVIQKDLNKIIELILGFRREE